ncbi:hypothetical protein HIM_00863 [Hirsutella minnesotensis 3608]|nr:hypothetical protein HIM_00863 [Hirsutella minnesotensis 3608]
MKGIQLFMAFVACATGLAIQEKEVSSPLSVNITSAGNAEIKAVITNKGQPTLKLLKPGSILSPAPIEKAKVFSKGEPVEFDGIQLSIAVEELDEDDFQYLSPGQSVEVQFDLAESYDLSSGGTFEVQMNGTFAYAEQDSTVIVGSVPYQSNRIAIKIDGKNAVLGHSSSPERRVIVQSDCTGWKLDVTKKALEDCTWMALRAKSAARWGPAEKLEEYFHSSSEYTRNTVYEVFRRVAVECDSMKEGVSKYYCTDVKMGCEKRVLAYTWKRSGVMVFCPAYFVTLPDLSDRCHSQDKASTNIHEITHLNRIWGTNDYGGYGYRFLRQNLTAEGNLNHADSFSLFASAIRRGC